MDAAVIVLVGSVAAAAGSIATFLAKVFLDRRTMKRDDFKTVTEAALALASRLDSEVVRLRAEVASLRVEVAKLTATIGKLLEERKG